MFPVLFRFGGFTFATYGLLVAAGYLFGIHWLSRKRDRLELDEDQFWNLIYALFFGALVGGKLLYFIVEWRSLLDGSLHPIKDLRYGFVFFGGLIGVCAVGAWWARSRKIPFFKSADYFSVAAPMGHAIGRLGCFAAGCCSGSPTELPWGVRFTHPDSLIPAALHAIAVHPTQLYEAFALAVVAILVFWTLSRVESGVWPFGSAFAAYIGSYSIARFLIEFFRGDDRGGFFLTLSPSQWIAVGGLLCAGALVMKIRPQGRAA